MLRTITPFLSNDLAKKMVLLSGPRQVGKSTLAKSLLGKDGFYLNWDIRKDKKIIHEMAWPKTAALIVLDEIHKYRPWKNYLKGIVDEFQNRPPILVTGSVRLETYRKKGDALTGRHFHYHLHPIDPQEAKSFFPKEDARWRTERLLQTGGFPEAFLNPSEAERLRNDRFDLALREDGIDVGGGTSTRDLELLIELLRERVGQSVNCSNLAEDLSSTPPTVKRWIKMLEDLYLIFLVPPYSTRLARSVRKEHRVYFYDNAAAPEHTGQRIENLVACSLLKYCAFHRDVYGKRYGLYYFRDRDKREVDFVVTLDRKPYWCIEVKTADPNPSPSLYYLNQRLKPQKTWHLVLDLNKEQEREKVSICSLPVWFDSLNFKNLSSG